MQLRCTLIELLGVVVVVMLGVMRRIDTMGMALCIKVLECRKTNLPPLYFGHITRKQLELEVVGA